MLGAALPWDFAFILLVLGVLVPWRGALRIKQLLARPRLETADRLAVYASTIAFQWLAVAVVAWRCSVRGLTAQELAIAAPDAERVAFTALALALGLGATQLAGIRRMARLPAQRRGFLYQVAQRLMPQNTLEILVFIVLAGTVALCEEFLYRGFVFAALRRAGSESLVFATLGSSALFALAHLYQGPRGLRTTFVVGLLFAAARLWTGSLVPPMLAHLVVDLVAGLAAPRLLPESSARADGAPATVPAPTTPPGSDRSGESP